MRFSDALRLEITIEFLAREAIQRDMELFRDMRVRVGECLCDVVLALGNRCDELSKVELDVKLYNVGEGVELAVAVEWY